MKSKKGGVIFNTILYVLFLVIIIIIFVVTFGAIKNGNKTTKSNKFDSLESRVLMVDEPSYNPQNYITKGILLGYRSSDFISASAYRQNPLSYETNNSIRYYSYDYSSDVRWFTYDSGLAPALIGSGFNSSPMSLSSDLLSCHSLVGFYGNDLSSNAKSFMLAYDCDILVEHFNFTISYNFPMSTTHNIYFYVLTDNGAARFTFSFSNSIHNLSFSGSMITSVLPSSTKVIRFGFPIAQSYNSTNLEYYLPQYDSGTPSTSGFNYWSSNSYSNYYSNTSSDIRSSLIYMQWVDSAYSQLYIDGYNAGYSTAINSQNSVINNLNTRISNLTSTIDDMRVTINNQSQIIANLQAQLNDSSSDYKDLFFTFADIPFKTVYNVLNFDFFGLNLFRFFTGVLTALGCIWLIKKFI